MSNETPGVATVLPSTAHDRFPPLHIETPLIECRGLARDRAVAVQLKMECYQPTGSFKIRGIGLLCQRHVAGGAHALISSSGGNAGYAAAFAGRAMSVPVTVVVPTTASATAVQRLKELDANVMIEGDVWDEADRVAQSIAKDTGAGYVPPFDDPAVWEGNATLVGELVRQGVRPDAVVVAVGGGGLLCGVAQGLHRSAWCGVPLVAVGTHGADAFDQSIAAGRLVTLPRVTSIAKSLGSRKVTPEALEWHRRRPVSSVVVSDRSALAACNRFADEHQVLVEPACGAALSLVYEDHESLRAYRRIVVVVCGGIGATIDLFRAWGEQLSSAAQT